MNISEFFPADIFWLTLGQTLFILSTSVLIGRICCRLFPLTLRDDANNYLSVAFGLSALVIVATYIGTSFPLGSNWVRYPFILLLIISFVFLEVDKAQAIKQCIVVYIFSLFAGISLLVPLVLFGAYNFHNDGFTYLAHSDWLQTHGFSFNVSADDVTPSSTQVRLYQMAGFRMGGSFLFAFLQSLMHVSLAHEVYVAVVISSLCGGMLAIGYPIAKLLKSMRWSDRYLILALPGFLLGGLIFGGNFGFLPQTVGLSIGGGFIFALGLISNFVLDQRKISIQSALLGAALSLLLAAATFAYSELAPFLIFSSFIFIVVLGVTKQRKVNALLFLFLIYTISAIILNSELMRVYLALKSQSGAIVGTPVDWALIGFIAHAFGFHGGAWDNYQWSLPGYLNHIWFYVNLTTFFIFFGFAFYRRNTILSKISVPAILPAFIISVVLLAGLIYFRYFVPDAFERGTGQSWSQFKLSDWASPFASLFFIIIIISIKSYYYEIKNINISVKYYIIPLIIFSIVSSYQRIEPLSIYYGSKNNLSSLYSEIVSVVHKNCDKNSTVYLNLQGENHKFRQILSYLLKDYSLSSDWSDDGYIFPLVNIRNNKDLKTGDCVIERLGGNQILESGTTVGLFRVGIFDGSAKMRLVSAVGVYDQESSGMDYWYWVEKSAIFKFSPYYNNNNNNLNIYLEYGGPINQNIKIRIIFENNKIIEYPIEIFHRDLYKWSKNIVNIPAGVVSLEMVTDGLPLKLGENDPRRAAFIVRNISIRYF